MLFKLTEISCNTSTTLTFLEEPPSNLTSDPKNFVNLIYNGSTDNNSVVLTEFTSEILLAPPSLS